MKKVLSIILAAMFIVAPVLSMAASAAVPYDHMIALYNMEGTTLKDDVSGKDGVLMNGASFVADAARGKVLSLSNDKVTTPGTGLGYDKEGQHAILADSHIPSSDNMTISLWYNATEQRSWARVIDLGDDKVTKDKAKGTTGTLSPNRFINIAPANAATGGNTIGTVNCNDAATAMGLTVPNNRDRVFADLAPVKAWVHVVLVINAKSGKPNSLYINGKEFKSTTGGAATDAPVNATFSPKDILAAVDGVGKTYLGRSRYDGNGDQIFNGMIDDVAIFDVALTADQVTELNKADLKAGNPAKVVATTTKAATTAAPTTAKPSTGAAKTGDTTVIFVAMIALGVVVSAVATRKARKF